MEKKEKFQLSKVYFIPVLALGLIIIFESISIIDTLKVKEKLSQIPAVTRKIISQPTEVKKGTMGITLEENQKIIPNQNLKAKISFNSPVEEVGGVDVILTFDPKLISIIDISGNKKIFQQIIINTQKQKEGQIKITAYQPLSPLLGERVLAFLTLRLLKNQPTVLEIEFLGADVVTDSN